MLRGFWLKIVKLLKFPLSQIPKKDLDTKKTAPNIDRFPNVPVP